MAQSADEVEVHTRSAEATPETHAGRVLEPSPQTETREELASSLARPPLPKLQIAILLLVNLAEPITAYVIYPFVNQLVRQTGVTGGDESKTGYFAGLIDSIFYAVECTTILQWGRASDRFGRKPIILVGLFGLSLSILSFGVSLQFWQLVLSRCAEGALNGNVGVVKCAMAECTQGDPANMAQAFALLPMVWTLGVTIGPIAAGVLSLPAERWPTTIGRSKFFQHYPYFLPCLFASVVSAIAFVVTLVLLKETSPRKALSHKAVSKNVEKAEAGENVIVAPRSNAPSPNLQNATEADDSPDLRDLLIRPILIPIANYAFLAFTDMCLSVLQPLMFSTSISSGGLSLSTFEIGIIIGVWGIITGAFQAVCFPILLRRVGPRTLYTASYVCFFVAFAMFPLMSFLAKRAGRMDAATWAVLVMQFVMYGAAYCTYGCIFIYITNGAPNKEALGATNGLAQMTASFIRAISPSTATSLFAASAQNNIAGGTIVYWIMCFVVVLGTLCALQLPRQFQRV
ncbi:MFS general substrate transporter [Coniophora puteana RWD-64-598 SS2]|uniref:MFS general substrate transporter n=1 Tax=Coniophora puteana (strain RWD-64-598) TaxID=741705 RepID=A0A5M3MYU9_CONPW|nr:MFS general substrate transporter [Coniophora puteana RWD-64-598 SS2]EIW83771.1 MFS general substrate transporter [Coniophora puteana RWD-64-598 SS2]